MESSNDNSRRPGDEPKPSRSDEPRGKEFEEKLARLQRLYSPFLNTTIAKLESSKDKVRATQLAKMKNLQQILTSKTQILKVDMLDRCEEVLKKLVERLKYPIASDTATPAPKIKTEPDEIIESPASPPQHDLNSSKSTPKIIPVERCATVERDFSRPDDRATLATSRSRLKDLMHRNEVKPANPNPVPAPHIPGLDMLFPTDESLNHAAQDINTNAFLQTNVRNQSSSSLQPSHSREGWSREVVCPTGDFDERRLGRDIDYRHSSRDVDDRHTSQRSSGSEHFGMQAQSMFTIAGSQAPSDRPSLLPRHVPTHNMGYSQSSGSVQDFHGPSDMMHCETIVSHQAISKPYSGNLLLPPNPPLPLLDRPSSHNQYSGSQRDYSPSIPPLLPTPKSFSNPKSLVEERDRRNSMHSRPLLPNPQVGSNKQSARERIMQGMDQVEKLGVSRSGALRKLKSDVQKDPRTDVPKDPRLDVQKDPRLDVQKDPRLEKEQQRMERMSLDEDAHKLRTTAAFGTPGTSAIPQMSGFSSQVSFGAGVFQSQQIQWQTTTVKQTTAHDLGMRYQPRSRYGKHTPQFARGLPSTAPKQCDDRNAGQREIENPARDSDLSHGKRSLDPRLPSKTVDERRSSDTRNVDPRRKDDPRKLKEDFSSPLNSLYDKEKSSKTGQGYGFQSYKIPKRAREPTPIQDSKQLTKSGAAVACPPVNRDPRLSKITAAPPNPTLVAGQATESALNSIPLHLEPLKPSEDERGVSKQLCEVSSDIVPSKTRTPSPVLDKYGDSAKFTDQSSSRDETASTNSSQSTNQHQSRVCSVMRSPSPSYSGSVSTSQARSKESSPSDNRRKSRGSTPSRMDSRSSGSPSRSRVKSRETSKSISPARTRGRSRSSSRARERSRSSSPERGAGRSSSRGRSPSPTDSKLGARSPSRSRGRSSSRIESKSRARSSSRTRGKSRGRSRSRSRGKSRGRSPSRSRRRTPSRTRDRSRGRSPSRTRGRSRGRSSCRTRGRSRERSGSRNRGRSRARSPSRSRYRSRSRGRSTSRTRFRTRSRDRSTSRSRSKPSTRDKNSSYNRDKSDSRRRYKSRAHSHSSDSDVNSTSESWRRKESLSPDRTSSSHKSKSKKTRHPSTSSGSNFSRERSRARSRDRSLKPCESKQESIENFRKHSSRSSSCSDRSSPLFPREHSKSRSPSPKPNFDALFQKSKPSDGESLVSSGMPTKDTTEAKSTRDAVVSSSLNSVKDDVVDVPTSTSENNPEFISKSNVGSSSEVASGSITTSRASTDTKQESEGAFSDRGNILVGLIKTLASKDFIQQKDLVGCLAELAASQLPEDKRNKVLELFKEGIDTKAPEEPKPKVLESREDQEQIDSTEPSVSRNVKGGRKKAQSKSVTEGTPAHCSKKQEISPEGTEKKKKRGKNELDKLHEDIAEMFIGKDVVRATGQRSCVKRKENKELLHPPKSRPGSADEKHKSSTGKSHTDDVSDSSDVSPCKSQISDTSESTSDYQPLESNRKLRYSSESEDEMPAVKLRKPTKDSSNQICVRRNKTNFLDSESESDNVLTEEDSKLDFHFPLPVVMLDKSCSIKPYRNCRKNVARRGRKVGSMSREEKLVREDIGELSCEEGSVEGEELKVEDKDMSQIDTSNIIPVEVGKKLTRNQLKLLKGPEIKEEIKSGSKRTLRTTKEISECDSDASKCSDTNLFKEDQCSFSAHESSSPAKKKRKVKKESKNVIPKKSMSDDFNNSVDTSHCEELGGNENINASVASSSGVEVEHISANIDVEMHEVPLISRLQNVLSQEKKQVAPDPQHHEGNHTDLNYCIPTASERVRACKLCQYSGKIIVSHYVSSHPNDEVLVSRLPQNVATYLKAEADGYQQDLKHLISQYSLKKKSSCPLKCLLCDTVAPTSLRLWEHLSTHTGEYRYSCTLCSFRTATRLSMKSHRKTRHAGTSGKEMISVSDMETSTSMAIVFAYVCSECNYFQLLESRLLNHLKVYHSQNVSARSIRISVSKKVLVKSEILCSEVGSKETVTVKENEFASETEASTRDTESISFDDGSEVIEVDLPTEVSSSEKDSQEIFPPSITHIPSPDVDVSIFIGSEQLSEDESLIQEKRRKLLEDVGEKLRDRPKMRHPISEKLNNRLSEQLPSSTQQDCVAGAPTSGDKPLPFMCVSSTPEEDMLSSQYRANLKTPPTKASLKSSDSSEKRLTRSTSRTTVTASDSECEIVPSDSEVPDEVRAPLPASTLHYTLQRMQETLSQSVPALKQNIDVASMSSACEVSSNPEFPLKKESFKVGLVEAKYLSETNTFQFFCLSPKCTYIANQSTMFLQHINVHPLKPVSAPCSHCEESENILRTLQSSLSHILKYHLKPTNPDENVSILKDPPPAVPIETSSVWPLKQTLIRPRKLPGDILSQPEKKTTLQGTKNLLSEPEESGLPAFVISSVVSLSKDHTPDGTPLDEQTKLPSTSSHDIKSNSLGIVKLPSILSLKKVSQFKKDVMSMQRMMRYEKLCHFFKCRGQHCSFSTNSKVGFADHYYKHLQKELKRRDNTALKSYEWQKCVYCSSSKDSGQDLVDHILSQHRSLKYQCSGCFYRATSAASVAFHQKTTHNSNVVVLECMKIPSDLEPAYADISMDKLKLYKCAQAVYGHGECGRVFVSSDSFKSHHESDHNTDKGFICSECSLSLDSSDRLIYHYSSSHSYRKYHCLHCSKASETLEEIKCHMSRDHPDQDMIVAARHLPGTIPLSDGFKIGAFDLGDQFLIHDVPPFTPLVIEAIETDICCEPTYFDEEPSLPCASFEIKQYKPWPQNKFSLESPNSEKSVEEIDGGTASQHNQLKKANGVVGLSGSSLYLCGYSGCSFKAKTSLALKEHLTVCCLSVDSGNLSCLHCQKIFRYPSMLLDHLPKHGVPRYLCSLCEYRTTHSAIVIRHFKNVHKISSVSVLPVISEHNDDPNGTLYKACQKEMATRRNKTKLVQPIANKTCFSPEERHLLPLSAVFTQDVRCTQCQYSTKVRSNMMRHLQQHALGCEPTVPVLNPVPCLERNEKMFDTMTNHAISSTIPVRRDSNAFKVTDEPKFVPENQRYVCCEPSCVQISSDDAMLRHHIRVLHPEILVYKCPHCPDSDSDSNKQPILLEKLGSHLKMHDSRLYSCQSCIYYHYQRHIVERHTSEKHPEQKYIRIVREPQLDGTVTNTDSEIGNEGGFECGLCSSKGTKAEVTAHVSTVHHTNALYKCRLCNFRSNSRARFSPHFLKQHPNEKEDIIEVVQKCKIDKPSEDTPQLVVETSKPPVEPQLFNSSPLWQRGGSRIRHLRGILFEENGIKPKEFEHLNVDRVASVGTKRSLSSTCDEDWYSSKREKKNELFLKCSKCSLKVPVERENDYREHLQSHFNADDSRFKCARCLKTFALYEETVTHFSLVHQQPATISDIIDSHSEENIKLDITRQILNLGLPVEFLFPKNVTPQSHHDHISSPLKTAESSPRRATSPRKPPSGGVKSTTQSPSEVAPAKSSISCDNIGVLSMESNLPTRTRLSPVKGIKPLNKKPSLKPVQADLHLKPSVKPDELSTMAESIFNVENKMDDTNTEMVIDESAFEKDIEEVEDEEMSSVAVGSHITESSSNMEDRMPSSQFMKDFWIECKYKDSHSCNVISKNHQEASFHEKKHWEVKPFKCGHCSYQAIKESYIKLHSKKKHPSSNVVVMVNDMPEVPNIVSLPRQQSRLSSPSVASPCASKNTPHDKEILEDKTQALLANDDELFKCLNVLRCGYCRLRETSLCRLFTHWQSCHKGKEAFRETTRDERVIVPFKFREIKLGNHERETMAFRCGLCHRTGTIRLLMEHYPTRHPGEKLKISGLIHDRVQCSLCPRQFSGKASLTSHFSSSHPGENVSSFKVRNLDSDFIDATVECFYCSDLVKISSDMKEHHLKFHSHLPPKFIEVEVDVLKTHLQQTEVQNSNSVSSQIDNLVRCVRPSVIMSSQLPLNKEEPKATDVLTDESIAVPPSSIKKAVARKSTTKVRAVARKSTGGKLQHSLPPPSDSDSSFDEEVSSDEDSSDAESSIDVNKITCPVTFEGTRTRVTVATLSQHADLYPTVELRKIIPQVQSENQNC